VRYAHPFCFGLNVSTASALQFSLFFFFPDNVDCFRLLFLKQVLHPLLWRLNIDFEKQLNDVHGANRSRLDGVCLRALQAAPFAKALYAETVKANPSSLQQVRAHTTLVFANQVHSRLALTAS
jgi:hypothetical protein